MATNQLSVGAPPAAIAAGALTARAGTLGDTIGSELHGNAYEAAKSKTLFNAANQAGVVTTVGLALTYTGLILSNPVGSNTIISVRKVGFSFAVAFAAAATVGLMTGYNSSTNVTHSVAGTPRSNYFGIGAAGVGLVDTSAVMPTAPVVTHVLGTGLTGAITTSPLIPSTFFDISGSLLLLPGGYTAIYTSTASGAASMIASFEWEEIPLV